MFVVPLYGNFVPSRVSFLLAMRYYAGNWAYNIWLFRKDQIGKLAKLTKNAETTNACSSSACFPTPGWSTWCSRCPSRTGSCICEGRPLLEALPRTVDRDRRL